MDSFYSLAKMRRSCRKFTDEPISPEQKEKLLKSVLMAPASKRSNPWEFIVVEDKQTLEKVASCKEFGSKLVAGASLAIIVIADPAKSDVWVEDASIASIYLQLAAEDLGLGSCWVQVRRRKTAGGENSELYLKGLLNVPEHFSVESVIAIGNKAEEKTPFDDGKLQKDKLFAEKYGESFAL